MEGLQHLMLPLREIDLSALKLVKETCLWIDGRDHSRWVFQHWKDGSFFKIWNPTYVRRDHLLRGIECGFYDESTVPALHAVILAKGVCRGYIMHKCFPNRAKDPVFHAWILAKTLETGYFCAQYSRYHAMRYGDKLSLIDLEAIYPLQDLPTLSSRYWRAFDDAEYERFVTDLYCRTFPQLQLPGLTRQLHQADSSHQVLSLVRNVESWYRTARRKLLTRWGTILNHVDRIEVE